MRIQRLPRYLRGYLLNAFRPKTTEFRLIDYLGARFLVNLREDVGWSMHAFRNFEDDEIAVLAQLIQPEWNCLDVGGNIGFYSVMLARIASRGTVVSCEPMSRNATLIATNRLLNNVRGETLVTLIGDRVGTMSFSEPVDSSYASIQNTGRGGDVETVREMPMMTIDGIVAARGHGFDFIKIDIEGAEELAVRGMSRLLSSPQRPKLLMLEVCDENLKAFGSTGASLVDMMAQHGYSPSCIRGGQVLAGVSSGRPSQNVLFAPKAP